jgi:HK97 family phage portal protein
MSLLQKARNLLLKHSRVASDLALGAFGQAVWTPRRYDLLAQEGYTKNAIAYRCIDEIAKGVSAVPINVYQRLPDGNRKELPDHPVAKLLRQPNPTQSATQLKYELANYLAIAGNAYVEGVGPSTGTKSGSYLELWVLRPDRMQVVPGRTGVGAYEHQINGVIRRFPVDPIDYRCDVKHVKMFHPLNDWYGLSPIEVAAMAIDTHNQTAEWNKSLLDNAARPEGAMSTEKALSDKQFDRLKSQLRSHSGSRNAGTPMLLENGLVWQQFSFSPRDMDFLESKHTSARDVCAAFGVPPMLLGIPGDNTYSNQKEARVAFYDITVTFYLQLLVEALSLWLLPRGGDIVLDYDLDCVPAMALRREQMFDRAASAEFLTLDEQRDMAGFGKLKGEGGDKVFVSTTKRPLEHALIVPPDPIQIAEAQARARASATPRPAAKGLSDSLKDARAAMNLDKVAFTLWLIKEGLSTEQAAEFAEMSDDSQNG